MARHLMAGHNEGVIHVIRERLERYSFRELPAEGRPRAAVLIPLYEHAGELHVVLTKRTDRVEHHKGEVSFPGGARDPEDPDLVHTALRESEEEIGLDRGHVQVIGRVDDFVTISQFHVAAYVGAVEGPRPYPWRPHAGEVAEVLEVPIRHLLEPSSYVRYHPFRRHSGETIAVEAYLFRDSVIWGATGRILQRFLEVAAADGLPARA
jgi:8-oxo-dGTP pyrophosphatase MutT (NUDIX family)